MKKLQFIVLLSLTFIANSCANDNEPVFSEIGNALVEDVANVTDSVNVSMEDVANVSRATLSRPESRQGDYSIETIFDDNGNPALYVVNYANNGGFVVVGATKNYYPVLAYNETGKFNLSGEKPYALKLWETQVVDIISNSGNLPANEKRKHRKQWKAYETRDAKDLTPVESRSAEETPEWYQEAQTIMMNKKMEFWAKPNCEVYEMTGEITGDESLDEEIREYVQGSIYPVYLDYWDVLSFVVLETGPDEYTNVPNFVETQWGQGAWTQSSDSIYYNTGFPIVYGGHAYVGCGGLATAQVMRYYKHPASFDWDNMPATTPTTTTAAFLYQVAEACNSQYMFKETLTNQTNCLSALQGYGYSANRADYSFSRILDNLENKKPVMIRAQEQDASVGHAWVVTGGSHSLYDLRYEVWTFNTSTDFRCAYNYPDGYYIYDYLYMNWGWGGDSDGSYNVDNLYIPNLSSSSGGDLENITCIYDITPNN